MLLHPLKPNGGSIKVMSSGDESFLYRVSLGPAVNKGHLWSSQKWLFDGKDSEGRRVQVEVHMRFDKVAYERERLEERADELVSAVELAKDFIVRLREAQLQNAKAWRVLHRELDSALDASRDRKVTALRQVKAAEALCGQMDDALQAYREAKYSYDA